MPDDATLLRRYATDDDERAFAELVHRRLGLVYAVALRQVGGDEHLARDVAQRVFADLARQARALSERTVLTGWLHRAARFTAIDVVRAERRRRVRETAAHLMQTVAAGSDAAPDWEELRPLLDAALSELSDADRDAVMLRLFEERPFAEIGAALRVSEDAARMRVDRALEKLRLRLRRHGLTSTTAALSLALAHQAAASVPTGLATSITGTALASAKLASGTATAGSVLGIMTAHKTAAVFGALAVLALGVGFHQSGAAQRNEEAIAALTRELAALPARPVPAPRAPSPSRTPVPAAPATAPATTAGQAALAALTAQNRDNYESAERSRTGSNDYQQAFLRAIRASTRLDYAALYRSLNLTAEQIARFEDLVVARAASSSDLAGARLSLGLDRTDPAVVAENARLEAESQAQQRAVLGDAGFEALQRFDAASPVRNVLHELAGHLFATEAPLTADQSASLGEIVARRFPPGVDVGSRLRTEPAAWDAMVQEARAVLSPAQAATLAAMGPERRWVAEQFWALNQPGVVR